jgi:signal transduction histidine kinase
LVGVVLDVPLKSGFWFLISVAGLLWTIASRIASSGADLAGALYLILAVALNIGLLDGVNFWVVILEIGVAVGGGLTVRLARRFAGASEKAREVREEELQRAADTAVSAEREMFARELHDVVSHAIGLIAVQTSAAEIAWPTDPDGAERSLAIIQDTTQTTLSELNRLLPGGMVAPRTISDLAALVDRIELAGTQVELTIEADSTAILAPSVYRIVQESLTNVVRHAPGATASVTVHADGEQVMVEITDNGRASGAVPNRGYGLVGLAERVALMGGALETGPGSGGLGFTVKATLPANAGLEV